MARTKKETKKKVKTKSKSILVNKVEEHVKIRKKNVVIVNNTEKKKVKRKCYSAERLERALDALETGLSIRKAAKAYGVPVATLARRKKNPVILKKKGGLETVLLHTEEEEIVNWIIYRAERGFPVTKNELLDAVQRFVILKNRKTPFINNRPGRHWYEGFRRRHPNISLRTVQHLSLSRVSVTQEDLKDWFGEQRKFLESKNLIDISPTRIFNCDESNILLCPDSDKVLTRKGAGAAYKVTDGGKEGITTLFMYSAAGTRAPPLVMFAYKEQLSKKIIENMPVGWGIGISESGWMTTETFFEYITNVFYPWLLKEKIEFPVVIYLDNHSSHINLPLVTFCRTKQIEIIGLYPNSTHIMQPLDISFFHPFKQIWKKTVVKWKNDKDVLQLKKENFPIVLKIALNEMKEEKNVVISGFRAAGLVPFNVNAIDYDILQKKKRKGIYNEQDNSVRMVQVSNKISNEDMEQHLKNLESNISSELLEEFNNAMTNELWTGDIEKKALFEYWLQIRKKSLDAIDSLKATKPQIKSVETVASKLIIPETQDLTGDSILQLNDGIILENVAGTTVNDDVPVIDITVLQESYLQTNIPTKLSDHLLFVDSISIDSSIMQETECLTTKEESGSQKVAQVETSVKDIDIQQMQSEDVYCIDSGEISNTDQVSRTQNNDVFIIREQSLTQEAQANKENVAKIANQEPENVQDEIFSTVFTLPLKYLPKKKRIKVEASGKPKPPSAATGDVWYKLQMEKEQKRKEKEEQLAKKKELQMQKKEIAEEKKKLNAKMKELQLKIKKENK